MSGSVRTQKARLLLVDDDDSLRRVLEFQLAEAGYEVTSEADGGEALRKFSGEEFDCLITDWRMPKLSGSQMVSQATAINSEIPIIVITAFGDVGIAVEAMRGGAFDFITKPFNREEILLTIEKALKYGSALAENRRLRRQIHEEFKIDNVVGKSEKMLAVYDLIERVSKTSVTVLIEGETGTGKELVAKGILCSGVRQNRPFVAINCAAIPETLIEAELFGYKRGAFTGAVADSKGKFEEANGGTLFLDEIGEMSLSAQVKLLRVLQDGEFSRVGGSETVKTDVRVIAASNVDLEKAIEEGTFRKDLFYRLSVFPIVVPPLRARAEDIHLLVFHFLEVYKQKNKRFVSGIAKDALRALINYEWNGNVRELENAIERAVIIASGRQIELDDLPETISKRAFESFAQAKQERLRASSEGRSINLEMEFPATMEEIEKQAIELALDYSGGDKSRASRLLSIGRKTLYRKLEQYQNGDK